MAVQQMRLPNVRPAPARKATIGAKLDDYDAGNLRSASYILEHPDGFGGVDSFPVVWALMVVDRIGVK